jgi:hypothetical protein
MAKKEQTPNWLSAPHVSFVSMGRGHELAVCWTDGFPHPVGLVWGIVYYDAKGAPAMWETAYSYVLPAARRHGIRTFIDAQIFAQLKVDVIRTTDGSAEGGAAYLRKHYKRIEAASCWARTRPKPKRRKR